MAKRDYYEVLECERSADETVLKASYRKLAMKWHPDRNQGNGEAEVRFKEVSEAYEVLKDPQKRAAYDRFGHAAFENGMGGGGAGGPGFGNDFASTFADIFDDLFGGQAGGRGRAGAQGGRGRGADLRYNMDITLEDAFSGKAAQINIPTSIVCETCSGSGAKPGTQPKTCRTCGGAGKIRHAQGFFTLERTCPACQGRGSLIEDPCTACAGAGRVTRERTLQVQIPSGVEDGTRIRLGGEGEAGTRGGPAGDLYIFLSIEPHQFFQREGADLYCRAPISMVTAALGGSVEVPTIDGETTKVRIPEGTQSGKRLRLSGKGMPVLRSRSSGDMYVQVVVETPQNLTKRQRELLAEFETEGSSETNPESHGFFAKMKDFFQGTADE
ncbi:MAG: molecular chaperone DnaJ [Rhizobiales bacterium 32-66-8]|nr:MAG: molecular chaperone DnaJ [Rhizobiales bacterium 32-66-8]